ncbi:MAG TPA: hypothetical protein VFQ20_15120 [Burkholderiaceae bacterium]|nr:hypothetical protein [Burkholderiaceae bacterium]
MLGYGWWQARTHAEVWLLVLDHARRTPKQLWDNVIEGRLAIRDAAGRTIAEAVLEPPQGLRWTGPAGQAVHCEPQLGRDAWQVCFDAQSRWMARWVPAAHDARVTVAGCTVDRVAVRRRDYSEWWFWWAPLPHVGGTPIAHYTIELHLDSARCAPATAP